MMDAGVFGIKTMNGKTWLTRNRHGIVNVIWLVVLFLIIGAIATVMLAEPATTQTFTPIVLDESRMRVALQSNPTTTTTIPPTTTTVAKRVVPTTQPPVVVPGGDIWYQLRMCECGGNYGCNTGNGYYGAYQFSQSTWNSMNTGYAFAHLAPPHVQDDAAMRLQQRSGWAQWPACTKMLGLR